MFKSFFKEIRWFLLVLIVLIVVLGGNILYFMSDKNVSNISGTPLIPWDSPYRSEPVKVLEGLKLTKLSATLYSLTGTVRAKDCEKIAPLLPATDPFTIILESPGGNLAEGGCLASHLKIRNVITVIRDTKVLNENGEVIYEPGLIPEEEDQKGKTICASACSLLFLAGDVRYLIGDVWLGIHGPRTPAEELGGISKMALEASAFRAASSLLMLLEHLGVEDHKIRRMFIQIPGTSMYWLNIRDFKNYPGLLKFATHYVNFWGLTTSNPTAGLN